MTVLDHKKKEAVVLDTAAIVETMGKSANRSTRRPTSSRPARRSRWPGYDCTVYDTNVSVTMSPGEGMNMTLNLTGPACLSSNAPGKAEYEQFYARPRSPRAFLHRSAGREGAAGHGQGNRRVREEVGRSGRAAQLHHFDEVRRAAA